MTDSTTAVATVTPETLKQRIDAGEDVFILDARNADDYEEWRIDAPTVDSVNLPYFDFLGDELPEGVEDVPRDERVTVLCAKGGSSEMVAEELEAAGYDAEHLADGMQGWARVYESRELDAGVGGATVVQYRRPSSGCLAYLVANEGEAAVVDPLRAFTARYVEDAADLGVDITAAVDTHIHADHISGVRDLHEATGATAVLPASAAARGIDYDVDHETVTDGDTIGVGAVEIEAVHTPGHTTGMTTYRLGDVHESRGDSEANQNTSRSGDVLFTGDGLFTESVARPDLEDPEAARDAARTLHASLRTLVERFDDDAVVAPAHFSDAATPRPDGTYSAELGDLVETMDALTMDEGNFVDYVVDDMPPRPANHESIIATNLGQESPDDDEAFELELGPNNCAASEEAMTGD